MKILIVKDDHPEEGAIARITHVEELSPDIIGISVQEILSLNKQLSQARLAWDCFLKSFNEPRSTAWRKIQGHHQEDQR